MSAPWARDGEPDLACALALVGRKTLGANRDGRAHITTSRVIVTWNHIEIGIGGEASITAGAMPAVLGQIGFVGSVVMQHGPLRMIERCSLINIRNALECKLAALLVRPSRWAVYAASVTLPWFPCPQPSVDDHHHGANPLRFRVDAVRGRCGSGFVGQGAFWHGWRRLKAATRMSASGSSILNELPPDEGTRQWDS